MIKSNHVTLVDCTLRDGGYYNDWDYSYELIENYLNSMVRSGVDVVEMGFRTLISDKYLGPTAYTTDRFLNELEIPAPVTVAVMLNAKEVVSATETYSVRRVLRALILFGLRYLPVKSHRWRRRLHNSKNMATTSHLT